MVGVISAFNFPVAVWAWNAALALVCGDTVVWKPSEKTPLTRHRVPGAVRKRGARSAATRPPGLAAAAHRRRATVGEALVDDARVPLSQRHRLDRDGPRGRRSVLAGAWRARMLELGGNNAMIVAPSADLDLGGARHRRSRAVGTAGQRCTTLRRLFVHDSVYDEPAAALAKAYASVQIGDPLEAGTLVGPADRRPRRSKRCRRRWPTGASGGRRGARRRARRRRPTRDAYYVRPALVRDAGAHRPVVRAETFAPILYVMRYRRLRRGDRVHNAVPQGLSSAIFTTDLREAEKFLSAAGSDCGIANVNIGTSGAEIGGAFGGEKETGGGRESGSDAWKAYMRRATNTINYGRRLAAGAGR